MRSKRRRIIESSCSLDIKPCGPIWVKWIRKSCGFQNRFWRGQLLELGGLSGITLAAG